MGARGVPHRELILDKDSAGKSKTLYHVDGVAAIHSQKIGNAIRTIDTWYEGATKNWASHRGGAPRLRHHPGKTYRQPNKAGLLHPAGQLAAEDQVPPVEQQHFVMAVLIRGGVFGDAS